MLRKARFKPSATWTCVFTETEGDLQAGSLCFISTNQSIHLEIRLLYLQAPPCVYSKHLSLTWSLGVSLWPQGAPSHCWSWSRWWPSGGFLVSFMSYGWFVTPWWSLLGETCQDILRTCNHFITRNPFVWPPNGDVPWNTMIWSDWFLIIVT